MAYRFLFSIWAIALLTGCTDIPRDNPLDPKNSAGNTEPLVLVEAFVNTAENIPGSYNDWALQGLAQVKSLYPNDALFVEYHRDLTGYDDSLNTPITSDHYKSLQQKYAAANPAVPMGVPDIYVNGAAVRISGASDVATVAQQLREGIDSYLSEKNYVKIEAQPEWVDNRQLMLHCTFAMLGNRSSSHKKVRIILMRASAVAEDVNLNETLPDLSAGGVVQQDFGPFAVTEQTRQIIVSVVSDDDLTVFQSVLKDVP